MRKKAIHWQFCLAIMCSSLLFGACPGGKNVKNKTNTSAITTGGGVTGGPKGCIKGRIVDEDGKGFSGVLISTQPATSPEVTDSNGFFEICHRRKIVNAETGETAKEPIPAGGYELKFVKDGFHARPATIDYKGPKVFVGKIVMVEKTKPLPSVVETKQKEVKRSGVGGKAPVSE